MVDRKADIVSQEQFKQTLEMLAEIREMITDRVDDLSGQLKAGISQITNRQDIANGRLSKHEERLLGLESEVKKTETVAVDIQEHGCHRLDEHFEKVEVLQEAGVFDSKWPKGTKTGALIGSGVFAGILIQYFAQILHWVSHLFLDTPK